MWSLIGQSREVDVRPTMEPDKCALLRAKGEWSRNDPWRLDCNGLEEGQDIVAIFCDGGQRIRSVMLCLTLFCQLLILYLVGDDAVFVTVFVCLAGVLPLLCPIRDVANKNLQDIALV